MSPYWAGANVFDATTSGTLVSTCTTFTSSSLTGAWNNYSNEPTGVAVNPNNNFIYIADNAGGGKLHELNPGSDATYCTDNDIVTTLNFPTDLQDVAYGNNTLFLAGGVDAEAWMFSLGANGVLGAEDDGPVAHFNTASLGFSDLEGIAYNWEAGTPFIISTTSSERYLGEVTTSGTLLRAYASTLMGSGGGKRSGITYAPGSQNPSVRNIYIVSRSVDNGADPNENDSKWWEISISSSSSNTSTPTFTATLTATPTPTFTLIPTTSPTPIPMSGSTWYIRRIDNFAYGQNGDIPVPGDYNGDGKVEAAVFRPSSGTWYIRGIGNFAYDQNGDVPVLGDYNGDMKDDITVFRP